MNRGRVQCGKAPRPKPLPYFVVIVFRAASQTPLTAFIETNKPTNKLNKTISEITVRLKPRSCTNYVLFESKQLITVLQLKLKRIRTLTKHISLLTLSSRKTIMLIHIF